jgi:5-methylcytosine-specific restriction endonuclease McrA
VTAASHGRSGRPWRRIREQILKRDPYCTIRGPKCKGYSTTVDHIVPLSLAPELAHDLSNLRGACGPCNFAGGSRITNGARGALHRPRMPVPCNPTPRPHCYAECQGEGLLPPWCTRQTEVRL